LEEPTREKVVVPEKEAIALAKALRHAPELKDVSLSCYGYINKAGVRALHVAVDKPNGVNGDYDRYDLRYKADKVNEDISRIVNNAVRRISAHFAS